MGSKRKAEDTLEYRTTRVEAGLTEERPCCICKAGNAGIGTDTKQSDIVAGEPLLTTAPSAIACVVRIFEAGVRIPPKRCFNETDTPEELTLLDVSSCGVLLPFYALAREAPLSGPPGTLQGREARTPPPVGAFAAFLRMQHRQSVLGPNTRPQRRPTASGARTRDEVNKFEEEYGEM